MLHEKEGKKFFAKIGYRRPTCSSSELNWEKFQELKWLRQWKRLTRYNIVRRPIRFMVLISILCAFTQPRVAYLNECCAFWRVHFEGSKNLIFYTYWYAGLREVFERRQWMHLHGVQQWIAVESSRAVLLQQLGFEYTFKYSWWQRNP